MEDKIRDAGIVAAKRGNQSLVPSAQPGGAHWLSRVFLATAVTGKRGIDAGVLRLARQLESLTAVLININKKYKARSPAWPSPGSGNRPPILTQWTSLEVNLVASI